jgi:hypothetical protein
MRSPVKLAVATAIWTLSFTSAGQAFAAPLDDTSCEIAETAVREMILQGGPIGGAILNTDRHVRFVTPLGRDPEQRKWLEQKATPDDPVAWDIDPPTHETVSNFFDEPLENATNYCPALPIYAEERGFLPPSASRSTRSLVLVTISTPAMNLSQTEALVLIQYSPLRGRGGQEILMLLRRTPAKDWHAAGGLRTMIVD